MCQLIGDTDWASSNQTAAKTLSNFGLDAVDLGFPVDSSPGPLYFLFGDALPPGHPSNSILSVPPDDALGSTTRTTPPEKLPRSSARHFGAENLRSSNGAPHDPAGNVQRAVRRRVFRQHVLCVLLDRPLCVSDRLRAGAAYSSPRPPPSAACPETGESSSVGQSVLAEATSANPVDFNWTPREGWLFRNMPSGFVYASAAMPATPQQSTIPVFGVARYRASIPYLAMAPRATFADPQTWSFFAGREEGHPIWLTRRQWESDHNAAGEWIPPPGAEIYKAKPADERCVGEHSVTWNAPLQVWLLLYTCLPWTVEARFAPEPWGPWSPPLIMLSAVQSPNLVCTLIQSDIGCPGLRNYWSFPTGPWPGTFYAPFVMDRFTQDVTPPGPGQPKRATIYWLVSTWNPYTVVVMQSTLELQ